MSYTTLAQLTDRYGSRMLLGLADRAYPATGVIDAAVVNRALADADAMIDGYLAVRYVLPVASVPALLVDLAERIAIWNLHTAAPDPKIEADYRSAMALLKDLSRGDARLSIAGIEAAAPDNGGAQVTDRPRDLTTSTMTGFI